MTLYQQWHPAKAQCNVLTFARDKAMSCYVWGTRITEILKGPQAVWLCAAMWLRFVFESRRIIRWAWWSSQLAWFKRVSFLNWWLKCEELIYNDLAIKWVGTTCDLSSVDAARKGRALWHVLSFRTKVVPMIGKGIGFFEDVKYDSHKGIWTRKLIYRCYLSFRECSRVLISWPFHVLWIREYLASIMFRDHEVMMYFIGFSHPPMLWNIR